MTLNLIYNNKWEYDFTIFCNKFNNWKYGFLRYTNDTYSNDEGICHCNPKNSEFDKLLLCFSDLYTDCKLCNNYLVDDKIERDSNEENFNTDEAYEEIINLIQLKPEVVFMKNYIGLYPLEIIDLLYEILQIKHDSNDNGKGIRYALVLKEYLDKIKENIKFEYFKYDLCKRNAFEYIKNYNHIGNNTTRLQLPYEIWEHVFTFI